MLSACKTIRIVIFPFLIRMWKVFYDDKDRPNRYLLAEELIRRPDIEDLEVGWLLSHVES